MKIHLICAARPNFMKIAPLYHALKKVDWADPVIVHTGQHYDLNMSGSFFRDLGLPSPDINLGVGSGTHAEQTGRVMIAYEQVLREHKPDLVVVVGDVNSTMAATIAASKVVYPISDLTSRANQRQRPLVAHVEAGLRSFDRSMPEEINRLVTDSLADMLWAPSADAVENLSKEGVSPDKIQLVGNIMIDSLEMLRKTIESQMAYASLGLQPGNYGVVTLHRPSNVDNPEVLEKCCTILWEIADDIPLVFPIHPRTRKNMELGHLLDRLEGSQRLLLPEPLSYVRFMNLVFNCRLTITDSGGVQEETSYLGIPCLTLRENTERPITITHGTNRLCTLNDLKGKVKSALHNGSYGERKIELWDGKTSERIVAILKDVNRFEK
ncbi:MAG: UDP-2,3-diacetamido-2,3-dideoxy-D-glucuronate 2-epimerase [Syntrophorhabdus sp. PtaU1.Bin050]|nr:MAG: UDP-2,3-diacetamido-2,3-dideoxy-D-glucuronate 2-epimerase [Syntrophorhabdus sp. PtaU1.Bin050]